VQLLVDNLQKSTKIYKNAQWNNKIYTTTSLSSPLSSSSLSLQPRCSFTLCSDCSYSFQNNRSHLNPRHKTFSRTHRRKVRTHQTAEPTNGEVNFSHETQLCYYFLWWYLITKIITTCFGQYRPSSGYYNYAQRVSYIYIYICLYCEVMLSITVSLFGAIPNRQWLLVCDFLGR